MKTPLRLILLSSLSLVLGCGVDLGQALLLGGESGLRTVLDVYLSDVYSDLPDLFSLPPGPGEPVDGNGDGGGDGEPVDGNGTGGNGTGGGDGELVGDAANGAALFMANSCVICHCDDAAGGCLPGAPNIQGKDFATIQERLQGETPHPGGKFPDLTDQDIADLEALLAELAGP